MLNWRLESHQDKKLLPEAIRLAESEQGGSRRGECKRRAFKWRLTKSFILTGWLTFFAIKSQFPSAQAIVNQILA